MSRTIVITENFQTGKQTKYTFNSMGEAKAFLYGVAVGKIRDEKFVDMVSEPSIRKDGPYPTCNIIEPEST